MKGLLIYFFTYFMLPKNIPKITDLLSGVPLCSLQSDVIHIFLANYKPCTNLSALLYTLKLSSNFTLLVYLNTISKLSQPPKPHDILNI